MALPSDRSYQARVLLEVYDGETPIQLALPHWNEDPRILIRTPDGLRRAWLVPDDAVPIMDGDDPLGAKSTELTGFTRFTSARHETCSRDSVTSSRRTKCWRP